MLAEKNEAHHGTGTASYYFVLALGTLVHRVTSQAVPWSV